MSNEKKRDFQTPAYWPMSTDGLSNDMKEVVSNIQYTVVLGKPKFNYYKSAKNL